MVDQQVSIIDEINRQISEFKINKEKKDEDGRFFFRTNFRLFATLLPT